MWPKRVFRHFPVRASQIFTDWSSLQEAYHRGCKLPTKHHLCGLQVFSGISQWWHSKFSPNNPQNLKPTQHRPVTNGRNPLASLPKSNLEIRSLLVRPRRRPPRQRGSSWPVGFWSYFEMGDELGCLRTRCKIKNKMESKFKIVWHDQKHFETIRQVFWFFWNNLSVFWTVRLETP